jgi:hypothetical protein
MFIIETLQNNGTWRPFRYKLFGDVATFNSIREARFAYTTWKGAFRPYGTNWRVVAAN